MQSTFNAVSNNKKIKPQNLKCSLTKDSGWALSHKGIYKNAKDPKPLGKPADKTQNIFRCITFQTSFANFTCKLYRKCSKLNEFSVYSCDTERINIDILCLNSLLLILKV